MKNLLLSVLLAFASVFTLNAQSFVSTEPSNRNALLEEFTGRNCGYCPDGHRIANEIAAANPGRFWAINIHAGSYAPTTYPNFLTPDGTTVHNYFSISGYPCGTVNRPSKTPSDRSQWNSQVNSILSQTSCANIAAIGFINPDTRILHLIVELYYTSNSSSSTNYMSAALIQDNILGSQAGGSSNPSQWNGSTYNHMHVFRDMITPTWGETVSETTAGSYHQFVYDYEIPEVIGSPNGVNVVLEDLNVIVFVAQNNLNVITANEAMLFISNGDSEINPYISEMSQTSEIECSNALNLTTSIMNIGSENLNSMTIYYDYNGVSVPVEWEGDLAQYSLVTIENTLPVNAGTEDITVTVSSANGQELELGAGNSKTFDVTAYQGYAAYGEKVVVKIWQDKYGNQTTWKIFNSEGEVVKSGGPYNQLPGTNTKLQQANFNLEYDDCYRFVIYDSGHDGINNGNGEGHYQLEDADGNIIFSHDGVFTDYEITDFYASSEAPNYITINPDIIGTGNVIGAGDYIESTKVALLAVPGSKSVFVNWNVNGETFTDPLLVIDALAGYEITANFSYDGIGDYENDFEIYPNPANNLLTIKKVNVQHVVILNINGQVMLRQDFSNTVDVSTLPKGMYFIKVSSADGFATKKFIKE